VKHIYHLLSFLISSLALTATDYSYINPVAIGQAHLLLISNDNEIMSFGEGSNGELGHGSWKSIKGDVAKPAPIKSLNAKMAKSVAAGDQFSMVLLEDGALYSFGRNIDRPAHGSSLPREIAAAREKGFVQIAAGDTFIAALSASGKVFLYGPNYPDIAEIVGLQMLSIEKIAAGANIILAIDKNNDLWSIKYPWLDPDWKGTIETPCKVNALGHLLEKKVRSVATGRKHVVVLARDGDVFSYGENSEGQLGHGGTQSLFIPEKIMALEGKKIVKVIAGAFFSAALIENGEVWWWGNLKIDNSGMDYRTCTPTKFEGMKGEKITDITAGPLCNALLIISNGNLLIFGGPNNPYAENSKLFFDKFEGIHPGYWTKENHLLQGKTLRDVVFTMMVMNESRFEPKMPKEVLFLIFSYLR